MSTKRDRSRSPNDARQKKNRCDDCNDLPPRAIQLSRDFLSRAVPSPPIFDTSAPGAIIQSTVDCSFQPASQVTGGLATADGLVWWPYSAAGAKIVRTLLLPNATPTTVSVVPTPLLRSNSFTTTYALTIAFQVPLMLPACITGPTALSNGIVSISNDPSGNFFQGRVVSGSIYVNSNVGGPATSFITGTVGASLVADLRGAPILQFERVACAGAAIFAKDQEPNTPITTGVCMQLPFLPRGQTICQRSTSEFRGTALNQSPNLTQAQNLIFVSHVATSAQATNYAPGNIATIPWGYTPGFTWRGLATLPATDGAATVVRVVHCFASMGTAGTVIQSVVQSYTVPASPNDSPTIDVVPNTFLDIRNSGLWVGTFFLWDIATSASMVVTTWMSRNDERDMAPAFVCRMDNVSNNVFINVSGSFFSQVMPTGLNQLSQQLKASPQGVRRTVDDQFETSLAFTTVTAQSTPSVIVSSPAISRCNHP